VYLHPLQVATTETLKVGVLNNNYNKLFANVGPEVILGDFVLVNGKTSGEDTVQRLFTEACLATGFVC